MFRLMKSCKSSFLSFYSKHINGGQWKRKETIFAFSSALKSSIVNSYEIQQPKFKYKIRKRLLYSICIFKRKKKSALNKHAKLTL